VNWMDSAAAAVYTASTEKEIRVAAGMGDKSPGSLHGYQRTAPKGKWRFQAECLDAWVRGEPCEHRSNVRQLRASA
jgi:hypothetical protein